MELFQHWRLPKLVNLVLATRNCDLASGLRLLHALVPQSIQPSAIELLSLSTGREHYSASEVMQIDHLFATLQRSGVRRVVWRKLAQAASVHYSALVRRHPWLYLDGSG